MATGSQFDFVHGKVTNFNLIDPDGKSIFFDIMDWEYKPDVKSVERTGLQGIRRELIAHMGASGSFTMTLSTTDLYDFFGQRQSEYRQGGIYRYSTGYGYINYLEGGNQVLTFTNMSLVLGNSMFKNDEVCNIKVEWKSDDVLGM
jgi:hypothetical protein